MRVEMTQKEVHLAEPFPVVSSFKPGLPTPKFCSEPHISLQGTSWEPKSNMQNHFRINEKKEHFDKKKYFLFNTFCQRAV